jgi:hypothetical protein
MNVSQTWIPAARDSVPLWRGLGQKGKSDQYLRDWTNSTRLVPLYQKNDVLERKPGVPKVGLNAQHSKCHQLIAILDDTPSRERMNFTGNFKGLSNDRRTEGLNHDYHHTISQLCDTIKMDSIHISCADDMAFVAATTLVVYIHFPFWPRICYFLLEL